MQYYKGLYSVSDTDEADTYYYDNDVRDAPLACKGLRPMGYKLGNRQ